MKSQSILHIDLTQNTNTTFSPFKCRHVTYSSSLFEQDTFEICTSHRPLLPYTELPRNEYLTQNLTFSIILLIILALIRLQGRNMLSNLLSLLFKRKKIELILSEEINHNLFYYIILLCSSASVITGFLSLLIQEPNLFSVFNCYIWGMLLLYHVLLLGVVQLLGWIFNAKYIVDECIINLWAFHIGTGIILFPFLVVLFFVPNSAAALVFKIALLAISILITTKIIRWIQILISNRVSILYMILYLCALEIVPLLILYKITME